MKLQRKLGIHYFSFLVLIVILAFLLYVALLLFYLFVTYSTQSTPWMQWIDNLPPLPGTIFGLLVFIVPILAFFVIAGFIYGKRMSIPIVYYMEWLERLAQGTYAPPEPKRPKDRKTLRLYEEMTSKMQELTNRLQQSEKERKELEHMRREWTSGVTHDLKTPLSYIQGYSSMLLSDRHQWSPQETKSFLGTIREKSDHIQRLIDDLNDSFRFEQNSVSLNLFQHDIVAAVRALAEDVQGQPDALKQSIRFTTNTPRQLWVFDKEIIERAVTNILMNAVIHNPPGTEITISVEVRDGITIAVSDNGIGMEPHDASRLFERYYRGTSTEASATGSGLGMAISKQFILAHAGSLQVNSAPGHGTTISIHLPFT